MLPFPQRNKQRKRNSEGEPEMNEGNVVKNAASVDQFKVEQAERMTEKSVKISI